MLAVSAHEPLRRVPGVVSFDTGAVILALVAEQFVERLRPNTVPDQPLPAIAADLIAKMSEQSAVGLRHVFARALAFGVIGFGHVDRDQPSGMARNDLGRFLERRSVVGEAIECQPDSGLFHLL